MNLDQWLMTGDWQDVTSSNVSSIRYLVDQEQLEVQFHGGSVYAYYGVTADIAEGMFNASSHGRYVWTHLRDQYSYQRLS